MARPEVWFAIPSANPENCRRVLPIWREMGYRTAVLQNYERAEIPADLVVWTDHYPGWAGSINVLSRTIVPDRAPIVVSGGDDMLPDPNMTAERLAAQFLERFPDTFGVMQPHGDDFRDTRHYCGSPWLGRAFMDRMYRGEGPMFPGYRHNWADVELYWVARCRGLLWSRPDLTQRHEHFAREERDKPAYWTSTVQSNDFRDVSLYLERKSLAFPGHEPIGEAPAFNSRLLDLDTRLLAEEHFATVYRELPDVQIRAMETALQRCAVRGRKRVAIYGAGLHTRRIAPALERPPVQLVAVIDDDPQRWGAFMWGIPIVSMSQAVEMRPDAVICSSDTREQEMWSSSSPLRDAGIEVIRLYTGQTEPESPAADLFATSPTLRRRSTERPSGLLDADAFAMIARVLDPAQPVVIVDVGANTGDVVQRAVDEFPLATVYAFEPAPAMAAALQSRFRGHAAVRTIPAAVGERSGDVVLHVAGDSLFSSVLPPSPLGAEYHDDAIRTIANVRVPMVSLDEWSTASGLSRVDVLKIDVQGLETAVIRGAAHLLRQGGVIAVNCEAPLIREYDGASTFADIDPLLNELGFELHQVHECWTRGAEQQTTCLDALWIRRDALQWLRTRPDRAFEIGWRQTLLATLHRCAESGARRVALYGGGRHTRTVAEVFRESPIPIVAILDDRAADDSPPIGGVPIVAPNHAESLGVDTVILSSNCHEEALWRASLPLRERGLTVLPLYRAHADASPAAVSAA